MSSRISRISPVYLNIQVYGTAGRAIAGLKGTPVYPYTFRARACACVYKQETRVYVKKISHTRGNRYT